MGKSTVFADISQQDFITCQDRGRHILRTISIGQLRDGGLSLEENEMSYKKGKIPGIKQCYPKGFK
jgi:hypothetical protein